MTCESTGTEVIDWSTLKRGLGKPPVTQIPTYAANPRLAKDRVIYHDTPREGIIGDEYHDRMGAAQREGCGAWEGGVHQRVPLFTRPQWPLLCSPTGPFHPFVSPGTGARRLVWVCCGRLSHRHALALCVGVWGVCGGNPPQTSFLFEHALKNDIVRAGRPRLSMPPKPAQHWQRGRSGYQLGVLARWAAGWSQCDAWRGVGGG